MSICNNCNCGVVWHSHIPSMKKWLIFKIPLFHGLSCFKKAHHELLKGLFTAMLNNFAMVNNKKSPQNSQQQESTKTSHIVCNLNTEDNSKWNYDSHKEDIDE